MLGMKALSSLSSWVSSLGLAMAVTVIDKLVLCPADCSFDYSCLLTNL